jgi:putative transcriptional regulator
MGSLKSHLLLAAPQLPDINFYRTVVLMLSHDAEGALGVVLNRPTDQVFDEIWSQFTGKPCECPVLIHWGGPVNGPPIAIHDNASIGEIEILPNVFMATAEDNIDYLVSNTPENLKLFCGYAGWAPNQLEQEIAAGGWLITEAHQSHLFAGEEDLWKVVASEIGDSVMFGEQKMPHVKSDPSLN